MGRSGVSWLTAKAGNIFFHLLAAAIALLVFLLTGCTLWANEQKLSLEQAVRIALEKNHDVRAFRNALLARKQDIGLARSLLLPRIALEERFTRTNNPPNVFMAKLNQERFTEADFAIESLNRPGPVTDFQSSATLEQSVFSGRTWIGLGMARKEVAAIEQEFGRAREETALNVVRMYLQVNTARAYLSVAKQGVTDAAEHVRIAESRERNGLGLYSDVLRARTALTGAEQKVVSAEKNLTLAKRGLGLLLGSEESCDTGDDAVEFPLADYDSYASSARTSRRDIRAMHLKWENAKSNVRLAASRYLPELGMRAGYQLNDHRTVMGNEGESWWLMGVLRWDLFDGAAREYEYGKARYREAEAKERLSGLTAAASYQLTETYLAATEAAKIRDLARAALTTAEEGKRLVKSRFAHSLSPLVDLLEVQTSVDAARASLIARENEYRMAIMRLNYESGTILRALEVD